MKNILATVSSLDKVFPNEKPRLWQSEYSAFSNEVFNFQVACYTEDMLFNCRIEVESTLNDNISVRLVEPLPAHLSEKKGENDRYILKRKQNSTLYPELLRPLSTVGETIRKKMWTAFWLTVNGAQKTIAAGDYDIVIRLYYDGDKLFKECTFKLTVLGTELPDSDLSYTAWFHYDCIAYQHQVDMFSDAFYEVLNGYLKSAVSHGMTMLYTPLFTPPLDTAVGHERETAQLVDVKIADSGAYTFGFAKLERFMDNAVRQGIKQFEFSHLATQWGAWYCPKIMAEKGGETVRVFGWDTPSDGDEYLAFLDAFLAALASFTAQRAAVPVSFHISDEPGVENMARFIKLRDVIVKHFPDAKIMDALCALDFYQKGIINVPVAATDHADTFIQANCLDWVYYCSWQRRNYVSNRFFNMPSQRNRILGMQLYYTHAKGFLHWGFNFYNTILSTRPVNPYVVTDAGGGFESGDCFFVYPDGNGVLESLRHEVFYDGLNDYRALLLLESLCGRAAVVNLLQAQGMSGFTKYKKSAKWHIRFREKLNKRIMNETQKVKMGETSNVEHATT